MMGRRKAASKQQTPVSKSRNQSTENLTNRELSNEPNKRILLSVIKEKSLLPPLEDNTNQSNLQSPNNQQQNRARSKTVQNKGGVSVTALTTPQSKRKTDHDQNLEQSSIDMSVVGGPLHQAKPPLSNKRMSNILVDNLENSTINNTIINQGSLLQSSRKQAPNTSQGKQARISVNQQLTTTKPPVGRTNNQKESAKKKVAKFDDYVNSSITPAQNKLATPLELAMSKSPARSTIKQHQQNGYNQGLPNNYNEDQLNAKTLLQSKNTLRTQSTMGRQNNNNNTNGNSFQQSKAIANTFIGAAAAAAKAADYVIGSCPYCLKNRCYIIELECSHSFCSICCLNLIKITKIKKGLKYFIKHDENAIKCSKCSQINMISEKLLTYIHEIRSYESFRDMQLAKNNQALKSNSNAPPCHLCLVNPDKPPHPAMFECLNCESTLMCYDCKIKHQKNSRHKDHQIVKFEGTITLVKTENLLCEEHKEKYKLFCFTEEKPLCLSCTADNNNARHSTHYVKSLKQIIEQANNEKERLQEEIEEQIDRVDSAIQYFNGVEGIFMAQKDLYLKKLSADFEVIYKLVERKHAELKDKITSLYDCSLKEAYQYVEGLQSIKETFETIKGAEIKQDMEQVNLNKQILYRIRDIETELDFELQGQDMDLIESKFVYEPFQKLENILMKYDFMPVQQTQLNQLEAIFTKVSPNSEIERTSKIITQDLISADFLLIMPPKMIKAELIYSYSQEQAAMLLESNSAQQAEGGAVLSSLTSQILNTPLLTHPQRFHARCDNKGPTLMFVKANEGHIFGGFNPTSWVSEFMYSECNDAYLFSITDGKGRKPIKCPVKSDKADKAVKQNEANYSPAFGEANISDLFIAFKKLENSYSVIGNVYKLPKGQKGDTFLAGKHNDWKIDDIEVWAITF